MPPLEVYPEIVKEELYTHDSSADKQLPQSQVLIDNSSRKTELSEALYGSDSDSPLSDLPPSSPTWEEDRSGSDIIELTSRKEFPSAIETCTRPRTRSQTGQDNITLPREIRPKTAKKSPYFDTPSPAKKKPSLEKRRRPPRGTVSCIPFPPLSSPSFGLIQEKLAHDPFKLLVAVTFLNRTKGAQAIPVFYQLMGAYPTPAALAGADEKDVASLIRSLGLQNTRARRYIQLAKAWVAEPAASDRRYRKLHYPTAGMGRDIKPTEILTDDDSRDGAWEIAHLPTAGPYALDSWRIFCRDKLRGVADGWNGEGVTDPAFEPEWRRVAPKDKELRAFLRWMWLRLGWEWDPKTGERKIAGDELMTQARVGGIVWEEVEGADGEEVKETVNGERNGSEVGSDVEVKGEAEDGGPADESHSTVKEEGGLSEEMVDVDNEDESEDGGGDADENSEEGMQYETAPTAGATTTATNSLAAPSPSPPSPRPDQDADGKEALVNFSAALAL
ncbi:MAG: hypothetical protein M1819_003650 [Sarea resinae]|nr:MAG: hypothetical protein M1819_003650 [Sarea resinae]